jgi:uncharacterized membrane protein
MPKNSFARIAMACAAACGALVTSTPGMAAELRGFASAGLFGVMLFQPCEGKKVSARALKVEDATPDGALTAGVNSVRKIMLDPGRPLYVEFSGDVAGLAVKARRFRRAVGTVEDCASTGLSPGTRLLAIGDEPPWQFALATSGGRFERPGEEPVRFPATAFARPSQAGAARVYDAWSPQDGGSIRLEVSEQMCSDGRSETAYGARATLRYGSFTYEGCAAVY